MTLTLDRLRLSRLPRVAAVLVAVVASLSLVVVSAKPAAAFSPTAPVVGAGLRAAPVAGPAAVACVAVPACAGLVALGGIGVTLYMTKDTWLPIVEGWLNKNDMTVRADGSYGCPITINSATPDNITGALNVSYSYGASCGCGGACGAPSMDVVVRPGRCVSTGQSGESPIPGVVYAASSNSSARVQDGPNGGTDWSSGATITNPMGCANNSKGFPYDAVVQIIAERGASANYDVEWRIPSELWTSKTDVECRRPDGTTFTVSSGRETGHPDRLPMPSCYTADPNSIPVGAEITGNAGEPLINWTPQDWWNDYPDCFGPSGLLCSIDVWVGSQKCVPGLSANCEYWWTRKDNNPEIDCRFGTYSVSMLQCEPLKRAYRTGATPDPLTDPVTYPEPEPEPDPTPPPDPTPDPTPDPSHDPTPCNVDCPVPDPPPTDPDGSEESCLGDAWSWNPIDWVYVPTKCAFVWAFVPKVSLSTRLDAIKASVDGKVPFSWVSGIGSIPTAMGGACPDWRIKIPGQLNENVVCESSFTHAIRAARPVFGVFMASLALWPLIRSVMYGSVPIIRTTAGKL